MTQFIKIFAPLKKIQISSNHQVVIIPAYEKVRDFAHGTIGIIIDTFLLFQQMRDWLSDYKFTYEMQYLPVIALLFFISDFIYSIFPNCLFNNSWTLKGCLKGYNYISYVIVCILLLVLPYVFGIDIVSMIPRDVLIYMSYVEDVLNIYTTFRWSHYKWYKMNGNIMIGMLSIFNNTAQDLLVRFVTKDLASFKLGRNYITKKVFQSLFLQILVGLHSSDLLLELSFFTLEMFNLVCKIMGIKNIYQYIASYIH